MSSEQKNPSSFISDQSQVRDLRWKAVYFDQRQKRWLNIHCWAPQIFRTKMDQTHIHLPMMTWQKKREIQRKFDLYFQICFLNYLTVARRSRMLTDLHVNVKCKMCVTFGMTAMLKTKNGLYIISIGLNNTETTRGLIKYFELSVIMDCQQLKRKSTKQSFVTSYNFEGQ